MRILIKIDTENDAFQPDPAPETARILEGIVKRIREGFMVNQFLGMGLEGYTLRDLNGNKAGIMMVSVEDEHWLRETQDNG